MANTKRTVHLICGHRRSLEIGSEEEFTANETNLVQCRARKGTFCYMDLQSIDTNWQPAERKLQGCRNCGFDIRGLYGSDRQAHRDGWCGN